MELFNSLRKDGDIIDFRVEGRPALCAECRAPMILPIVEEFKYTIDYYDRAGSTETIIMPHYSDCSVLRRKDRPAD